MDILTFTEKVKNETLYESVSEDSLPHDMLQEWATNKRYTGKMARRYVSTAQLLTTFPEGYLGLFDGIIPTCETYYRSVDAWSVQQAIIAEGKKVSGEQNEAKKKNGLFGLGKSSEQ